MACRDCKLWDRRNATTKDGRLLSNRTGRCLWVSTEPWPFAMTTMANRPAPGFMSANEGDGCPCFVAMEASKP